MQLWRKLVNYTILQYTRHVPIYLHTYNGFLFGIFDDRNI